MVVSVVFLNNFGNFPLWFTDEVDWLPFLLNDLGGPPNLVGKRLGMPKCLGSFDDRNCRLKMLFILSVLGSVKDWVSGEKVNMCHFLSLAIFNYVIVLV